MHDSLDPETNEVIGDTYRIPEQSLDKQEKVKE